LTVIRQHFRCICTRLKEVGKIEIPKTHEKYEAGQLFIHKVFGYRGVLLFPWVAQFNDLDVLKSSKPKDLSFVEDVHVPNTNHTDKKDIGNNSKGDNESSNLDVVTYYLTLIDERDCPHISAQYDAMRLLEREKDPPLYSLPGLDYVQHEDVLPYNSDSNTPIHHKLFNKFLIPNHTNTPNFTASASLHTWHRKNYKSLKLSCIHRETTGGIRVTVIPVYLGEEENEHQKSYWWQYFIRLEYFKHEPFQLCEHHWRMLSLPGSLVTVRGRGVDGKQQQPILSKDKPAFQYGGQVSLLTPSGCMWGTYRMVRSDGSMFEVRIPVFSLKSNNDDWNPA